MLLMQEIHPFESTERRPEHSMLPLGSNPGGLAISAPPKRRQDCPMACLLEARDLQQHWPRPGNRGPQEHLLPRPGKPSISVVIKSMYVSCF